MGFQAYLIIVTLLVMVIGVIAIVRAEQKRRYAPKQNRGVDPGKGMTRRLILGGGLDSLDDVIVLQHTKDPQAHAKAFVPSKARSK